MVGQIFIVLLAFLIPCHSHKKKQDESQIAQKKLTEAVTIAVSVTNDFYTLFETCVGSTMGKNQFLMDDLQSFVNYPARTTVGFAPRFTINRKFFGNMLQTTEFKAMLEKDEDELRKNLVKKMWFCDEAVMDQELLKDFYDREVDQAKVK